MLQRLGHQGVVVENGEALRRRCALGVFDAAICDVNLEAEDGIELCLSLRQSHPALALGLMTGEPAQAERACLSGFPHVLLKPFTGEEFSEFLRSLSKK